MKRNLFSFIAFFMPSLVLAQKDSLVIGDTLPDISLPGTINYATSELQLKDLRGKAIILDFWSPSCISCIEKFPVMDSLQRKFKDSMQIILVNTQTRDSTLRFFAMRKKIHMPNGILITGDTLLSKLFPHYGEPYHVWIDQKGVVRHLADSYNATPENVATFISGKNQQFVAYRARQQYVKSLFDQQWQDKLRYYSYISNAIRGTQPGSDLNEDYAHLNINNASIVELFMIAYGRGEYYKYSRPGALVLHVADSFQYVRPKDNNRFDTWFEAYCFNYDLQLPKGKTQNQYQIMQEDLKRYFNFKVMVHKKEMPCWFLIRTSAKNKVFSKRNEAKENFRKDDIREPILDSVRYLYRQPFKTFASRLGGWIEQGLKLPFIDATGFNELIDIQIPGNVIDNIDLAHLKQLRVVLQNYDMDLVKKPGLIEVLELEELK